MRRQSLLTQCTLSDGKPCLACERQANLHIRIEETKRLLEKLIVEEREAREDINHHHDPIQRLPFEITTHVFRFILPGFRVKEQVPDHLLHSGKGHCEHQGLTLGAVCRSWRNLTWSIPLLWCNVMITLHYEPTWNQINVMKDWLERSKPMPLNISLFLVDKNYVYAPNGPKLYMDSHGNCYSRIRRSETLKAFVDLFSPHSARWETLSIQCHPWLSERLTGDGDHGAPLLKTLQLMNTTDSDHCLFQMAGPKPAPTWVCATGYESITALTISWSNVTHVTLDRLRLNSYNEFLRLVPRLVDLSLQNILWDPFHTPAVAARPPIELPLRKLLVSAGFPYQSHNSGEMFYSIIFDSLVLPLLEDLTVMNAELPFRSVKRFLERSCPPLEHLVMDIICTSEHQQEALEFLYCLPPSLSRIVLNWVPLGRRSQWDLNLHTIFDHLARLPTISNGYPTGLPQLLPHIERFVYYIDRQSSDPALWGRLPEILRPISGNPRPLKLLAFMEQSERVDDRPFLYKSLNIEKSVIQGIIGLLDDGVDVHLPHRVTREHLLALLED